MTTRERPAHDPLGLEVVTEMEQVLQPKDMLFFGSRARGDWSEGSDIDAMAIFEDAADGSKNYQAALDAGRAKAKELYADRVAVELVLYSEARFHRLRTARTSVAYNAAREGISVRRRGSEDYGNEYSEPEPDSWPDIEQRFINAQRHMDDAEPGLGAGMSRESVGWQLARPVENNLKGYLAYEGYDDGMAGRWESWTRSHDMEMLQEVARAYPDGSRLLKEMDFSRLTDYEVKFQYGGEEHQLEEHEVLDAVKSVVGTFMEHLEEQTCLKLPLYEREGPRPPG